MKPNSQATFEKKMETLDLHHVSIIKLLSKWIQQTHKHTLEIAIDMIFFSPDNGILK